VLLNVCMCEISSYISH